MIDHLDLLLERSREPEPSDDLFVARVVQTIRTDTNRSLHRRRFVTRPIALAGAAVLVCGGAVAAVVSTTRTVHQRDDATKASRVAVPDARTSAPLTIRGNQEGTAPSASAPAAAQKIYRRGNLEWGYTSLHSSYVLDRTTGLRVATETYENAFTIAKRHRVTVELANTGKHPISLDAPKDCMLQVMGFSGSTPSADPSGFQPRQSRDASTAGAWRCAGSSTDPRSDQPTETIVLKPGERRAANTDIVLQKKTSWTVLGLCRCSYTDDSEPEPPPIVDDPLRGLNRVATTGALVPFTQEFTGTGTGAEVDGLFAPPVGLRPA